MVNINEKRIERLIQELYHKRYQETVPMHVEVSVRKDRVHIDEIDSLEFEPLKQGDQWGQLWDSSWFYMRAVVPETWEDKQVVALVDIGGEGCVFRKGSPYCGITYKRTDDLFERKRRIMLFEKASAGQSVELLIEGAANGLFGEAPPWSTPWPYFRLNQAELAIFDKESWDLALDLEFLLQLYRELDADSVRAKRIMRAITDVANLSPVDSDNLSAAKELTERILSVPASPSALTAWSVGHAHLDLGWLWRYQETRRKAGRTFSTALRMIEEYPEYIFGASQPQLFQWIKDDYPELYREVKQAVKSGRIEIQGGMWVEPDMNLTGGESLVRQCIYGKRFFKEEFGKEIRNLWLPDVFGYSAALPQILKKSGIDYFMTQKISWNETNDFPHHTFMWHGIDGTGILTHFLPANDYNSNNEPEKMIQASKRFAQSDIHEGYLNLFGIGDGGGGPSRRHIEWGTRGKDCEGMPKIRFAKADEFFDYLGKQPVKRLPSWQGELYLELHRGTYTTQALIKKNNRRIEHLLRQVELLGVVAGLSEEGTFPKDQIEAIWKETLLNQFHDVLPGSSIREVYEDANSISEKNIDALERIAYDQFEKLLPVEDVDSLTLFNSQPWERMEIIKQDEKELQVVIPPMGCVSLEIGVLEQQQIVGPVSISDDRRCLENNRIRVKIAEDGHISSIYLKEIGQEILGSLGAGHFKLFEDKPYFWDAWDISPYYKDTIPEQAILVNQVLGHVSEISVRIEQEYRIGKSTIKQSLELRADEPMLRASCVVDWQESEKMLKVLSETAISWPTATYEIQFGAIQRPTHSNTSWDEAKFEVCAHRYADLSQTDKGLALINDCKYGYRIHEQMIELTLLRSPLYPDAEADRGKQEFAFAYLPHRGMLHESRVVELSHNFNDPPLCIKGRRLANEDEHSFFSIDTKQVTIEVVKYSEDGDGIVIRCYETMGGACSCSVSTPYENGRITEVNLVEEALAPLEAQDAQCFTLDFKPFEIRTFRID